MDDELRARVARWSLPLTLLAVLAVFGPGLQAGFVYDDQVLVVGNTLTDSLANIPRMFRVNLWDSVDGGSGLTEAYYRPLFLVSLAVDRAIAGLDPRFAHLHSLLWHGIAVVVLDRLLRRVVRDPLAAAAGTALFALHPVQVEAVQWIAARNDAMAAALLLGGLSLLTREIESGLDTALGALLVLAAMLCKESALLAPVLLVVIAAARGRRLGDWRAHLAVWGAVLVYGILRAQADVGWPESGGWGRLFDVGSRSAALYAERLLWPVGLAPITHLAWAPPTPWLALAALLVLLVLLQVFGGPVALLGLIFAALGFAPALGGLATSGLLADRYLYLPMAGLALALAAALEGRRGALPGFLALLLGLSALAGWQLPAWKDEETLWLTTLAERPSAYAAGAYAKHLELEGRLDEAARWNHEATLGPKPYSGACYNVASLHLKRNDPETAAREGRRALEAGCKPTPELLGPLSLALALSGAWEEADAMAAQVGSPDPTGKAVLVAVAAAARRGDLGPLDRATASADATTRAAMARQIATILERGGATEAAATVAARYDTGAPR